MTVTGQNPSSPEGAKHVGGRYLVEQMLGYGGTSAVYRARDESTGKTLALKRLSSHGDDRKKQKLMALFEREYHTLKHLAHPSVIEVYDYGLDQEGPYYTMELLEAGDLWDSAPVAWRKACVMLRDVCSSLALLHSRRLIHRDISPRNVRLTSEGRAKLIDFGSLAVMGYYKDVVGTPSFIAPEVVNGLLLDGRTDLYALGAVAYWTLTGRRAYPVRTVMELKDAWRSQPTEPARLVAELPAALSDLVMSMLSLDPLARPVSAAEVIERLTAVAELPAAEPLGVAQSYLTTPTLVGREDQLLRFRRYVLRAIEGNGGAIFVEGEAGVGRSRLLSGFALEGKLAGAVVLQASGEEGKQGEFGVIRALVEDLLLAIPELALETAREFAPVLGNMFPEIYQRLSAPPEPKKIAAVEQFGAQMQRAINSWLLSIARERCLVLAVDDAHLCDTASAALLAILAHDARRYKLVVAVTVDPEASCQASRAIELLRRAGARIKLRPLSREDTEKLLQSVFGESANLKSISGWIQEIAHGNPRISMELAQHLVDQGIVSYRGGAWKLPESVREQSLPPSLEQALDMRVGA